MSTAYKCDITGTYYDNLTDLANEQSVELSNRNILGVNTDIRIKVEANTKNWSAADHFNTTSWTEIMREVKAYIETTYGV